MIKFLTSNRLAKAIKKYREKSSGAGDGKGLAIKVALACLLVGLSVLFMRAYRTHSDTSEDMRAAIALTEGMEQGDNALALLPPTFPLVGKGVGVFLALIGFVLSLLIKNRVDGESRRSRLIIAALWFAAIAALISWLPADILKTQAAISGKALAGETPSIPVYFGKLALVGFLILSPPIMASFYFRISLM
ncbi:MAG: hypothetical protein KAG66_22885, partial [Methylococcales bacterium]|nr:hypothetical protein [Methylococcales bacterium]